MTEEKKYWFRRKSYGMGWTPHSWEGWAVTILYVVGILWLASRLDETMRFDEVSKQFLAPLGALTILLIAIAWRTGETLRWQWGGKPTKKNANGAYAGSHDSDGSDGGGN